MSLFSPFLIIPAIYLVCFIREVTKHKLSNVECCFVKHSTNIEHCCHSINCIDSRICFLTVNIYIHQIVLQVRIDFFPVFILCLSTLSFTHLCTQDCKALCRFPQPALFSLPSVTQYQQYFSPPCYLFFSDHNELVGFSFSAMSVQKHYEEMYIQFIPKCNGNIVVLQQHLSCLILFLAYSRPLS